MPSPSVSTSAVFAATGASAAALTTGALTTGVGAKAAIKPDKVSNSSITPFKFASV